MYEYIETMCTICTEPYNKSTREPVQCSACDHITCKECSRRYLMTSPTLPSCMNCKARLPLQFLVKVLNRSWVMQTYKTKMTEILTGNQLGLLPDTQVHVEADIRKEKLVQENGKNLREIRELNQRMLRLKMVIRANEYLLRGEHVPERYHAYVDLTQMQVDTRRKFIMSCPLENCRGFLSTHYKCGTCQKQVCSECLCLKEEEHTCIESNRLSAEMIKRETKPCPKCGTRIHKIDGCDQMYCTNQQDGVYCNTAFSWRTGVIETKIHNPHFYELQQKQGILLRNVGDVQCGGMPRINGALRIFQVIHEINQGRSEHAEFYQGECPGEGWSFGQGKKGEGWYQTPFLETHSTLRGALVRTHRRVSELVQYTATDYRERIRGHEGNLLRLRIAYMRNKITKETFADLVYKEETLHMKRVDLQQVLELLSISGIETFVEMMAVIQEVWDPLILNEMITRIQDRLDQLSIIREYCNEQFKHIGITYNCSVPEYDGIFNEKLVRYNMNGEKKK